MLDVSDPNNFTPWFTHRLAIALRFVDVFTGRPVENALRVAIPGQRWEAVYCATDSTYRFLMTASPVSSGAFQVVVEDPEQIYVNHQSIELMLTPSPPMPPIARHDYLHEFPLWPTRRFKVPMGETALVGRLVSASAGGVGGLDVRIFPAGEPPPSTPFARSNADGEFLFRLPQVTRETDGTPIPLSLEVQVSRDGIGVSPVTPSTFRPEPGQVRSRTFEIP